MTPKKPFRPGRPLSDSLKYRLEQADMVKRMLGPTYELQQRIKALESPLASLGELRRMGGLEHLASLQRAGALSAVGKLHAEQIRALEALATPAWMRALQETAGSLSRQNLSFLKTQELLTQKTIPATLKLARTFAANQATVATLIATSNWTDQFTALSQNFAPALQVLRLAAERAQMLDMMTLRASADAVAKSAAVVAAEHVLEAHRLMEAIGHSESPAQSASLLVAFATLMADLFSKFGENTLKELRGIGAIKLVELFVVVLGIIQFTAPADMPQSEKQAIAQLQAQSEKLQHKLDEILAANDATDEAYVHELPRAELNRAAAFRKSPDGDAKILMRGEKGMLLAVRESRGRWRLAVYRDPLTGQLSEGWVYAPAVRLISE